MIFDINRVRPNINVDPISPEVQKALDENYAQRLIKRSSKRQKTQTSRLSC